MIKKLTYDSDIKEMVIELTEKLNKVIDVVNCYMVVAHDASEELHEAAAKAAQTGFHSDLKRYLALRKKYL